VYYVLVYCCLYIALCFQQWSNFWVHFQWLCNFCPKTLFQMDSETKRFEKGISELTIKKFLDSSKSIYFSFILCRQKNVKYGYVKNSCFKVFESWNFLESTWKKVWFESLKIIFFPLNSLLDSTFTLEEVEDILGNIASVVKTDIESELINASHTNVLLLKQIFSQAEKWHLNLNPDLAELENRF